MKTINDVKDFWEKNPLFSGESRFKTGTKEFFDEHRKVYIKDVFAGNISKKLFIPILDDDSKILDLGCGVGFWTVELQKLGIKGKMFAADLTSAAIETTSKRLKINGMNAELSIQNAEKMTFPDSFFSHINCQGVLHHTPDTDSAIIEISRILENDGSAYISVYYKNIFLKYWKFLKPIGKLLSRLGAKLKGRGRENIFELDDIDDITRLYDGKDNPIGKSYSKAEIIKMVEPYFYIEKVFLNFFPIRVFPFKLPRIIHKILSRYFGFMIHLKLKKK